MLFYFQPLVVNKCPEGVLLILADQPNWVGWLQFVLNIENSPRVVTPLGHILGLGAINLNNAGQGKVEFIVIS